MNKIKFKITGLTCGACLRLFKIKIGKIGGIKEIHISNLDGDTEITAERKITLDEIQTALSGTGYKIANI